jgi:hypothetical protein
MSKTPNYDSAVKKILDQLQPGERVCALTGEKWLMTDEEIGWYKKFNVPPSKYSPASRWKILGAFTIGSQIWYQKHPETGKFFVSSAHPATGIKGLPDKDWYDRDFSNIYLEPEFNKGFFDHISQLIYTVPIPAERSVVPAENSLALVSFGCEDSYFVVACKCKRTFYSIASSDVEDSAEVISSEFVGNSYNILHSKRIFNCKFVRESLDCDNCSFVFDCRNCSYCFGAVNQRNKKYLFFGEQLSENEWHKKVDDINLGNRIVLSEYLEKFKTLIVGAVWPENFNERVVNCSGEYIADSNEMRNCYFCRGNSQNEFWCTFTHFSGNNNAFCFGNAKASDCYYSIAGNSSDCKFGEEVRRCLNVEYCCQCSGCEDCFGCVGLQNKRFCIFNKQYTEEEYWPLIDELKMKMLERDEYGEFFPLSFSPSYFLQTCAVLFYGADLEFAKKAGVKFFDPESEGAVGELGQADQYVDSSSLPNNLTEFDPSIWSGRAIFDTKAKRRFSFLHPELEFYGKLKVVPPNIHYTARVENLYRELNAGIFIGTECANCGQKIQTTKNYAYPDRKIYCHSCYLKYLERNN